MQLNNEVVRMAEEYLWIWKQVYFVKKESHLIQEIMSVSGEGDVQSISAPCWGAKIPSSRELDMVALVQLS